MIACGTVSQLYPTIVVATADTYGAVRTALELVQL